MLIKCLCSSNKRTAGCSDGGNRSGCIYTLHYQSLSFVTGGLAYPYGAGVVGAGGGIAGVAGAKGPKPGRVSGQLLAHIVPKIA